MPDLATTSTLLGTECYVFFKKGTKESAMLPNFLIIGAPRAGTTWIDTNLRLHPGVCMAQKKEVNYFDLHYDLGIDWYQAHFRHCRGEAAVGEASPDYLHGQWSENDIPALIYKALPDVKLIACLRNPVDRAFSRYLNAFAKHDYNLAFDFEQKLAHRPQFIREGFYYDHLQRFLKWFPRDQLLVVFFDDLRNDPKGFMSQIYEFIGVDSSFHAGLEKVQINAAAGKRNLAKSRAAWYLSRALSRARLYRASDWVRRSNTAGVPQLTDRMRNQLIEIYKENNLLLQDMVQRDLSHWNRLS
jgi:hypothetical protein